MTNARSHPFIETARLAVAHVRGLGWHGTVILRANHLTLLGLTGAQRFGIGADNDNDHGGTS